MGSGHRVIVREADVKMECCAKLWTLDLNHRMADWRGYLRSSQHMVDVMMHGPRS